MYVNIAVKYNSGTLFVYTAIMLLKILLLTGVARGRQMLCDYHAIY